MSVTCFCWSNCLQHARVDIHLYLVCLNTYELRCVDVAWCCVKFVQVLPAAPGKEVVLVDTLELSFKMIRLWFQILCFIFTKIWGRLPIWLMFFQVGWNMLKPPTRCCLKQILGIYFKVMFFLLCTIANPPSKPASKGGMYLKQQIQRSQLADVAGKLGEYLQREL